MSKQVLAKITLGKFCVVGQTVEYMEEGDEGFGSTTDIILRNKEGRLIGVDKNVYEEHFTEDLTADVLPPALAVTGPNDVPDEDVPDDESGIPGSQVGGEEDEEPVLEEDVPPQEASEEVPL